MEASHDPSLEAGAEEEFDFDDSQIQIDDNELKEKDKQFLASIEDKAEDVTADENNQAFTFWFLILLLLLFVFFLAMGAIMIMKGKCRREEYAQVGYR